MLHIKCPLERLRLRNRGKRRLCRTTDHHRRRKTRRSRLETRSNRGTFPARARGLRVRCDHLSLCCVLLFALCASRVRVNAFDFFPISNCVKSFLRAALPFARRPTLCSSRGVTRRVLLLLLLLVLVLLCVVFFRRRKTNTNTNSERGDGIEPIRGNESTSGSTDDWAKSGIERRGRRGRTVDVVRRRRRIRGRFWWIWNGVWWVWVWVRRYVVLRRVRVFDVRRRRRVR